MVRRSNSKSSILPLLLGTDSKDSEFRTLSTQIVAEVKPRGAIEELLVADVVSLTWDILLLRRLRSSVLDKAFSLGHSDHPRTGRVLMFQVNLGDLGNIERLIALAENRRYRALRTVGEYRADLGSRVARTTDALISKDVRLISPDQDAA